MEPNSAEEVWSRAGPIFAFWSQWGGLGRMAPGWLSLKLFMTLRLVTALRATAGVERRSDKEQAQ